MNGLFNSGIDYLNRVTGKTTTSLHVAILRGELETCQKFIKMGADVNSQKTRPLHTAILFSDPKISLAICKLLLENRADPNVVYGQDPQPPLHEALERGYLEVSELLLQHKADPNGKGRVGRTPFHTVIYGLENKGPEIQTTACQLLVNHRANPNLAHIKGKPPLLAAIANVNPAICDFLLQHGADANAQSGQNKSLLNFAIKLTQNKDCDFRTPQTDIVKMLVENKADLNAIDGTGLTPLQTAVALKKGANILRVLVDYGVDFDENSRNYLRSLFAYNARSFANINAFLIKRPKIDTPEIFDGYAFSPIPQENNGLYNKPIALLNMASYEALNAYYGAIAQYFHPSHLEIYSALAKYYTVVRVLVEDPCHLPRILEVVKTSLQLACTYWALNGHGNDHALQLGFGQLLMISDEDLMREIAKLIECGGIVSLWGCSNAMKTINLVRTFSENAQDRLVEGSTDGVIGVTCREIWAPGSGRVSVPLTFFHTPGHFQTKTYLNGEVIAEGHTGWQSHL